MSSPPPQPLVVSAEHELVRRLYALSLWDDITEPQRLQLWEKIRLNEFDPAFVSRVTSAVNALPDSRRSPTDPMIKRRVSEATLAERDKYFAELRIRGAALYLLLRLHDERGYFGTARIILAPARPALIYLEPAIDEKSGKPLVYD